jgi:hypothetical protein
MPTLMNEEVQPAMGIYESIVSTTKVKRRVMPTLVKEEVQPATDIYKFVPRQYSSCKDANHSNPCAGGCPAGDGNLHIIVSTTQVKM